MKYLDQYLRDIYTLLKSNLIKNKFYMFLFYNYLCFKNVFWKIFWINFKCQRFGKLKFHFWSFSSFFATFTEIFIYNIYYFKSSKETPFIIDCWANVWLSMMYFKYLYPNAIVDCYEPDIKTIHILKKNIEKNNFKNVKIINKAISDTSWSLQFYSMSDTEWWTWNTLEKNQVNFKNIDSYNIETIKLSDNKYDLIDFLKMDIEWTEWKVFNDFQKTNFLLKVQKISLEYHYDYFSKENSLAQIISLLENNKFNIIVNVNTLVDFYITEIEYNKLNKKYVLMLNCFR